ncbi:MAG: bifunctional diaminohydroxyphosphoribosylaminopyrimidine deaminase/5-amino-6-(5-phosphoribosylamino)uracil reductase RibD [Patescibacteria group bacterium]
MPKSKIQSKFMFRALELAKKGAGFVAPNPLVGCVIVEKEKIIVEGYHRKYGGAHAEVEALKKIKDLRLKIKDCVVYVTHEPCVTFEGKKTPSCAEALVKAGVKRVVIGMKDPNTAVNGRGVRKLRAAGIDVEVGILQKECEDLNEVFIHWVKTKKPFVVLKVATTLDGALAFKKNTRSDFSSSESYKLVHELRQQYDAIGVGINTVLVDDPLLTTRRGSKKSRNPVRVVFDTKLRMPFGAKLLRQKGQTIIFTGENVASKKRKELLRKFSNLTIVETLPQPSPTRGGSLKKLSPIAYRVSLQYALRWLGEHGITSILIEGGAEIVQTLLREKLVDKLMLTITPHVAQDKNVPRLFENISELKFIKKTWERHGGDIWFIGYPK